MKWKLFFVMLLVLNASAPAVIAEVQVGGVKFSQAIEIGNTPMSLKGYGLLRYMVLIKAYAGALYLAESSDQADALDPVAKRLELQYFHAISREDFARATRKKIMDNVSGEEAARIQLKIDQFAELYRSVEPGDRYSLTYLPGEGTELALNGQALGTIPGSDFARAVFAIWLGPNPIDSDFRDLLLGST